MKKVALILSNLILVGLTAYLIHDMQTSQGIGYYFAIKAGHDRAVYDLLVDLFFLFFFAVCLVIPFLSVKISLESFTGFAILFTALCPTVSTGYIFSLLVERGTLSSSFSFDSWASEVMNAYYLAVPFFVLTLGYIYCISEGKQISRKIKILLGIALLLTFVGIAVPALNILSLFIGAYLIIYVTFVLLEQRNFNSLFLYGFLFASAVYKILSAAAAWS